MRHPGKGFFNIGRGRTCVIGNACSKCSLEKLPWPFWAGTKENYRNGLTKSSRCRSPPQRATVSRVVGNSEWARQSMQRPRSQLKWPAIVGRCENVHSPCRSRTYSGRSTSFLKPITVTGIQWPQEQIKTKKKSNHKIKCLCLVSALFCAVGVLMYSLSLLWQNHSIRTSNL